MSKQFRADCRDTALLIRRKIAEAVEAGDFRGAAHLSKALVNVAKYGGLLAPDELAAVESSFARLLLAIGGSANLTAEQKSDAISQVNQLQLETMGDDES